MPSIDEDLDDEVGAALAAVPLTVERTYRVPFLSHAQIEPGAALARWDGDRLELWVENQGRTISWAGSVMLSGHGGERHLPHAASR